MITISENKMTIDELHYFQSLPLQLKVSLTKQRIREWVREYGEDGVYVSFSGGKDSTVLLHIAREMYPNIKAVFIDTGLEYPEIRQFVKTFDNVDIIKPKLTFRQVIEQYGYPIISKEVAECVYGARKYLTYLLELEQPGDRQTDPTRIPNYYAYTRITGTGVYAKPSKKLSGGGTGNSKLRGVPQSLGEQTKGRRSTVPTRTNAGDAERQERDNSGEYP